ncbi:RING-variant domain containing protein [Leishmania donovani]|uniref:RING-variant domain family protein n=1 Tax=Leishmania donovani TaxID=5661 RepID=A0A504XCV6_LEIDO|nr:RING-variant domain family protein [Leishmania donovani]CAJ1989876.1 RING-variant domain containing protein [Leishmania donovani]VDZ45739.1 RING-variant_domain_containing_protein_putative/Pfam:PF12906 [Leishmania donovani]
MPFRQAVASMLAVLVFSLGLTSTYASSPAKWVPTLALFDINNSRILSTTGTSEAVSLGQRSLFVSRYDPNPSVSVASLTFYGSENGYATRTFDFLTVPYCVVESGTTAECNLHDHMLYMMFRFRHRYEADFHAVVWQDPTPLSSTVKALQDFKAHLNRSDVVYPENDGSMRVEESATCSDIMDECYLSRAATYTRSYKEIDPAQYSARFLFRIGKQYTMNGPLRVRLHSNLPHDAETVVDVVLVLCRQPSSNPLNHRWWIESVTGRLALLVVSIVATFAFLTVTREVGELMVRQRTGEDVLAPTLLYSEEASDGPLVCFQRLAKVASNSLQAGAAYVWAKIQELICVNACCASRLRWLGARCPRVPAREHTAESEREITALNLTVFSEEEDSGPTCRICRCSEPRDDLFAPCACNGSSKFVHHNCLEQWREMTSNPQHRRVCAECKTPYTFVRVVVPHNPDLITGSPIIESVVRHFAAKLLYLAMTVLFAVGGAYCLKAAFFLTTLFDTGVDWGFYHGYHWVLTAYFLAALTLNLSIMEPFVRDTMLTGVQLLCVLLSLLFIEIPMSYAMSAFLSLIFDRLFTWEVSYGAGLVSAVLLHLMDTFSNFAKILESFSEEREVVAARAESETQQSV